MFHLAATDSDPNLAIYHFLVPSAVTPRFTDTNTSAHSRVLLYQLPSGAAATINET